MVSACGTRSQAPAPGSPWCSSRLARLVAIVRTRGGLLLARGRGSRRLSPRLRRFRRAPVRLRTVCTVGGRHRRDGAARDRVRGRRRALDGLRGGAAHRPRATRSTRRSPASPSRPRSPFPCPRSSSSSSSPRACGPRPGCGEPRSPASRPPISAPSWPASPPPRSSSGVTGTPSYPDGSRRSWPRPIPDAVLTVYEGAGHSPNWEQPGRVATDIEAFLRRVAPVAG